MSAPACEAQRRHFRRQPHHAISALYDITLRRMPFHDVYMHAGLDVLTPPTMLPILSAVSLLHAADHYHRLLPRDKD